VNSRTILIVDMQIGSRRREAWGDINALGASMAHDDLPHPLVVHDQWELVARSHS
jgi:hypothetical protein